MSKHQAKVHVKGQSKGQTMSNNPSHFRNKFPSVLRYEHHRSSEAIPVFSVPLDNTVENCEQPIR